MRILFVALITLAVFVPDIVSAEGLVACTGPYDCDFCAFISMMKTVVNYITMLLVLAATVALAVTGVQLAASAGNADLRSILKDRLTHIIIGFLLIAASWTIVDLMMKALVTDGKLGENWSQIVDTWTGSVGDLCFELRRPVYTEVDSSQSTGSEYGYTPQSVGDPNFTPGSLQPGQYSHDEALALLEAAGVTPWSSGQVTAYCNCPPGPASCACTSLQGIQRDVVNQVLEIADSCTGCRIQVNGGTEPGHESGTYSHGTGYKIDLATDPSLNSYLESTLIPSGERGGAHGGPRYVDQCGNEYVRETNFAHWDITVNNGSCSL